MKHLQEEPDTIPVATNVDWVKLERVFRQKKELPSASLLSSFKHAFSGIKATLIKERNFKIQVCCAVLAVAGALIFKISLLKWLILTQVISFVLTAELINTALEHVVDLSSGGLYHPIAKAAKDTAAGAVLMSAIFALIAGIFIFGPSLLSICAPHFN